MRNIILVTCFFIGGIIAGLRLSEKLGRDAGYEIGYAQGIKSALSVIDGTTTK